LHDAGAAACVNEPLGSVADVTQRCWASGVVVPRSGDRCCDAMPQRHQQRQGVGPACCLACGCGYTVLQSVADGLQSVTGQGDVIGHTALQSVAHGLRATGWPAVQSIACRVTNNGHTALQSVARRLELVTGRCSWLHARGLPSDPHQLLRGWMGRPLRGLEVLGRKSPLITTAVISYNNV
jgi:hypothetical protein